MDDVEEEEQDREGDQEGGRRDEHVGGGPALFAEAARVGVDAPGHALQAERVHDQEGGVEADEDGPEVPLAQGFVELAAGDLGEPVVDAGEDGHHAAAEEHVVEVCDHVVGLVELGVDGDRAEVDAGDAADQEGGHEAEGELHRQLEVDGAAPGGGDPVEELDAGGDRDQHGHDHVMKIVTKKKIMVTPCADITWL